MHCHATHSVQLLSRGLEMCSHSCWEEAEAKAFIGYNHQVASCTDKLDSGNHWRAPPRQGSSDCASTQSCCQSGSTETLCRPHLPPCLPRGPASAWGQLCQWQAAQAPVPACSHCTSGPAPRAAAAAAGWHPALSTLWWRLLCSHLPELLPGLQVMMPSEVRTPAATSLQ